MAEHSSMKIGVHFTIDEELLKKIDQQAKAEQRSRSSMANLILDEYYAAMEKKL